jgi:radical SAM-linked protein
VNQPVRQRLRITFAHGEAIKYISHLDLVRTWERALRRASVPLAYSQGFNPRPKITFAAALPVGVTGRREVMDLILERLVMPLTFAQRLAPHLPNGLEVISVEEVYLRLPSLQSQVRAADYCVEVEWAESRQSLQARVDDFLTAETFVRQRRGKTYDLRPLVKSLSVGEAVQSGFALRMCLGLSQRGTARHDEVLDALGLAMAMRSACRERLFFDSLSATFYMNECGSFDKNNDLV